MQHATYVLMTGLQMELHFVLVGADGRRLVTSAPHDTPAQARAAVSIFRDLISVPACTVLWQVPAGYGFTVSATLGILAESEPFATVQERDAALAEARRVAAGASVVDERVLEPEPELSV